MTMQLIGAPKGLNEDQQAVAEVAFEIGSRYAKRDWTDLDAGSALWDDVAKAGFVGLGQPEEYGGAGTISDFVLVMERISAGGFNANAMVLSSVVAGMLAKHATEEQKAEWLARIISGEARLSFALTEPQTGSNAFNMKCSASLEGDVWKIKGEKIYISGLESAAAVLLVAQDRTHGGLAGFLVPMPTEGFDYTPIEVLTPSSQRQYAVYIDIELPSTAFVGTPAAGKHSPLFSGLNPERLAVAAMCIGVGRWCLNQAVEYANSRVVFKDPIGAYQSIAHPLAESYIQLEGAWALLKAAADAWDRGERDGVAANVAKIAAVDAGQKAADVALQTFGGSGYTAETRMFQRFAFMRLQSTVPVSRQMGLNHVSRALGLPKSY